MLWWFPGDQRECSNYLGTTKPRKGYGLESLCRGGGQEAEPSSQSSEKCWFWLNTVDLPLPPLTYIALLHGNQYYHDSWAFWLSHSLTWIVAILCTKTNAKQFLYYCKSSAHITFKSRSLKFQEVTKQKENQCRNRCAYLKTTYVKTKGRAEKKTALPWAGLKAKAKPSPIYTSIKIFNFTIEITIFTWWILGFGSFGKIWNEYVHDLCPACAL